MSHTKEANEAHDADLVAHRMPDGRFRILKNRIGVAHGVVDRAVFYGLAREATSVLFLESFSL